MRLTKTWTAAAAGVLTLALAGTASAHITANPAEGPADGFATVDFQVPHACEESPTTRVRVQVPSSVPQATPGVDALWDVETKEGPKDEVELHGETVTKGVSEVIFTFKEPLAPGRLASLPISVKLPAGKAGDVVYFPTIQECEQGETRWIQVPAEGESGEELESPAPAVTLTAAQGHGGAATEPVAEVDSAAAGPTTEEGAPTWLAIVALVVGALGLIAGVAGLTAARRGRAA